MIRDDAQLTQESIPAGFDLERKDEDVLIIRHKRTGMGCMNMFLCFWLAGWTVGCIILLLQYLSGGAMDSGDLIPPWVVVVFWGAEIVVAVMLTYILFSRRSFRLDAENMIMETQLLGLRRTRLIPRTSIRRLVQVKDGGEGEDSFPSWGLRIEGDRKATLIYRQPHDKSRWLGHFLARWADVEFSEVPND